MTTGNYGMATRGTIRTLEGTCTIKAKSHGYVSLLSIPSSFTSADSGHTTQPRCGGVG